VFEGLIGSLASPTRICEEAAQPIKNKNVISKIDSLISDNIFSNY
jgi:hypothetical protein